MSGEFESALREMLESVATEAAREAIRQQRLIDEEGMGDGQDDRFLLRSHEAAEQLAISTGTLSRLAQSGELPCVRVGRTVRYSSETIREWIREKEATGEAVLFSNSSPKEPKTTKSSAAKNTSKKKTTRASKAEKTAATTESRKSSNKTRLRKPDRPKEEERRISPFSLLLEEIGVSRSDLPPVTNGDLRRVAEVDIGTMHGWLYLNRELPETALNKLREHYGAYRNN